MAPVGMNRYTQRESSADDCFALSTRSSAPISDGIDLGGWSRRGFLGTLAVIAGGAVVAGCTPGGMDRSAIDAGGNRKHKLGDDTPGYIPKPPFALTTQSVLSEDYFLITNHKIDPTRDKVMAYSRADGHVEAVVLQDGVVRHVYRDTTQPGGWVVYPLPGATGVLDMVAGISAPVLLGKAAPTQLKIFYRTAAKPDQLAVVVHPLTATSGTDSAYSATTVAWDTAAGPLRITTGSDLSVLVSAMVGSSSYGKQDARLYFWHDAAGAGGGGLFVSTSYVTGFDYDVQSDRDWAAVVSQYLGLNLLRPSLFLYIPERDGSRMRVWTASDFVNYRSPTAVDDGASKLRTTLPVPPAGSITRIECLVATSNAYADSSCTPTAIVWTRDNNTTHLWALTFGFTADESSEQFYWTELSLPAGYAPSATLPTVMTALTPRSGTAPNKGINADLLDMFLVHDGTLHVMRQAQGTDTTTDATHPTYTPWLPLQPDVLAATSQAGVSTGNELLLVGTDGSLQTLEQDPVSGSWTDHAIQLPADDLEEASSYRVTMTLTDTAWNAAVPNHQVTITASTPAVAVIEGPIPQTVTLGADPVTVSTDFRGEVAVALLADSLSTPTLTVIADGLPTAATIHPSGPVNDYLQGDTKLNLLPAMSGSTLTSAKTPDGQTVAPGAADAGTAADAFGDMKQVAGWGAQGSQNNQLGSTVGRPSHSRTHHNPTRADPTLTLHAQATSLTHWLHDAVHAIQKGVLAVENTVKDVANKIVSIVTKAVDWLDKEIQIAVKSIEDAAHVLHSLFNKIGAEIVKVVKWIQAAVGSLLQDSAKVATEFETLLEQCTTFIGGQTDGNKQKALAWVDGEQAKAKALFDRIRAGYAKGTTLDNIGANKPAKVVSGSKARAVNRPLPPAKPALRGESDTNSQPPHGDWFLNKVKHALTGTINVPDFKGGTDYTTMAQDLRSAVQNVLGDLETAGKDFWTFLKTVVTHPSEMATMGVPALLEAVSALIDAVFDFVKGILEVMFDLVKVLSGAIPTMLETSIGQMGIVGKLLSLAGLGKYTLGQVAMMIFAFPATLVFKIANGADTRPFGAVSALQGSSGSTGSPERDLQITAASVMGVWAGFDTISAALGSKKEDVPVLFNAIDVAAPFVIGALAPPTSENGLPVWKPSTGSEVDTYNYVAWVCGVMPGFFAAHSLYIDHNKPTSPLPLTKDDAAKLKDAEADQDASLWRQTTMGVGSLLLGILAANADPDADEQEYAVAILNSLANVVGFLGTTTLTELSDAGSLAVAAVVTLFGGVAGAAEYGIN